MQWRQRADAPLIRSHGLMNCRGSSAQARMTPNVRRPTVEDSNQQNHVLKSFIKDKYDDKIYVVRGREQMAWCWLGGRMLL